MLWVLISRPRSHVLRVKTPVSGSRCLIHWLTHPDFQRKSCDKGLEAVTKQPRGAAVRAMTYQDQVPNTVTLKVWYHTSRCALARGVSTLMQVTCASAISMRKACLSTLAWLSSSGAEPNQQNYFSQCCSAICAGLDPLLREYPI